MSIIPIVLTGETLGQRHRCLNNLVERTFNSDADFQEIQSITEKSPIDRLFKIDLASKLRDVDYIIKNLKDDDMLYVSRALKSKWLLSNEFQNIINPEFMENDLYPYMITTAVSKMKCWVSVNLKDPDRCQQFYEYYFERNFALSLRFLTHCHDSYIINQLPNILDRLDPFYLKVFCEKIPQVAEIFFNSLTTNEKVLDMYLKKEIQYYDSIKVILKANGALFLDITEKYFNQNRFKRLSPVATKYIMNNFKNKFVMKTELYAAWLLDISTLAECLTVDECKDVTTKLARAEYLSNWFTYKTVEPLIKRIPPEERSAFKNKVFVQKDFGEKVQEWQYDTPARPEKEDDSYLFDDITHEPHEMDFRPMLKKRKCCKWRGEDMIVARERTLLDQLFDEFRFMSFEKTLFELRKRIVVESAAQSRQYIMLVLVSKTGGRANSVAALLQLLAKHQNEPPHVRATVVRSLVKRACVWRLPQDCWDALIMFAAGLGLDGKTPEAECREGLHAVVLRHLLGSGCIEPNIFAAFTKEFSTLKEYSLTDAEQKAVAEQLPALLLASIVNENDTEQQANLFNLLFETLDSYKLSVDTCPVIPALAALANKNISAAKGLLLRLFHDKKARRELFDQNFVCVSTDDSYVNALRHHTEVLKRTEYIKRALGKDFRRELFFRKLSIYYTEANGLADIYLSAIKESLSNERDLKLARPLAILIGPNMESYLTQLDSIEDKTAKRFCSALKANAHHARPRLNIKTYGYRTIGPKAVANIVHICRKVDIEVHLEELVDWPRTIRLALIIAERLKIENQTFTSVVNIRPNVVLKCAIKYFRRNPDTFNQDVWEIVKPVMRDFKFESVIKIHYSKSFWNVDKIPERIRADYCTVLFYSAAKNDDPGTTTTLYYIEKLLPKVNCLFTENVLSEFLKKSDVTETLLYLRILLKFLLLSKTEEEQEMRYKTYAEPFLETINKSDQNFTEYFREIITTLRYNYVFFHPEFVSCLPVFEKIVIWMHKFCPIETCFKYYGDIHLTMLFFKSVRQCLKHNPNAFKDDKATFKKGVELLGRTFGTYIAKEVDELKSSYFESMIELYQNVVTDYLSLYFQHDPLKELFIINIIRGIVEHGEKTTPLLGIYLFRNEIYYLKNSDAAEEIISILNKKDVREIQFFMQTKEFI